MAATWALMRGGAKADLKADSWDKWMAVLWAAYSAAMTAGSWGSSRAASKVAQMAASMGA